MLKLALTLVAAAAVLAVPATLAAASKPRPAAIERTLLRQMNGGPAGRITRLVDCRTAGKHARSFTCDLESVRSTHLGARVTVGPSGLSTTWAPLVG
jgi:hypothetical protein